MKTLCRPLRFKGQGPHVRCRHTVQHVSLHCQDSMLFGNISYFFCYREISVYIVIVLHLIVRKTRIAFCFRPACKQTANKKLILSSIVGGSARLTRCSEGTD